MEKEKRVRIILSSAMLIIAAIMFAAFLNTDIEFLRAVTLSVGIALIPGSLAFYKTVNHNYRIRK